MTETGRFFDGTQITEFDQAEVQKRFRGTGVIYEAGSQLAVLSNGNSTVSVSSGEAMVEGFHYKNTAFVVVTHASNVSGFTRIDAVVLRLDRNANTLAAAVVQGVPNAGNPALTQSDTGVYEFPLAYVYVLTGTPTILQSAIQDVRVYSKRLTTADEINIPITTAADVARRVLQVDPATKLLYFADAPTARPNILHNSSMRINQRGVANAVANDAPPVDRWKFLYAAGSGTYAAYTAQSSNGGMAGTLGPSPNFVSVIHSDANAATDTTLLGIYQPIEGTHFSGLVNRNWVLSFYAYATKAGTYGFTIQQVGGNLRYNGTFTITVANSWQWFWFSIPYNGTNVWVTNTGASMYLEFIGTCGISYKASGSNLWNTEGKYGAAGITNSLTATNDYLGIGSPKLEIGESPSPYRLPDINEEQVPCYRYLWVPTSGSFMGHWVSSQSFLYFLPLAMQMRAAPAYSLPAAPTFVTASPTGNQVGIQSGAGYVANLTYSSAVLYTSNNMYEMMQLISSTAGTTNFPGAAGGGIMIAGGTFKHIFSAEI